MASYVLKSITQQRNSKVATGNSKTELEYDLDLYADIIRSHHGIYDGFVMIILVFTKEGL